MSQASQEAAASKAVEAIVQHLTVEELLDLQEYADCNRFGLLDRISQVAKAVAPDKFGESKLKKPIAKK